DRANRIYAGGGAKSFDEAITMALDQNTLNTLRTANPALADRVRMVEGAGVRNAESTATASRLSGEAGMTAEELEAVVNSLPPRFRHEARRLIADQAQVYSPRRITQEMLDQHRKIMDAAAKQGVRAEDVYYLVPAPNKSYGTMAMA